MTPDERRESILDLALTGEVLAVEVLAARFGTSRETIRRDLAALDQAGLLRRVHGGAVAPGVTAEEGPFRQRMGQHVAAKRAIARHVATGLAPGDSLFLDTGTTTLYLAEEIAKLKGLIIITNSADIASACAKGRGNRVLLIGGEFRLAGQEAVGPLAVAQIGQLRAARAVLTVAALSSHGVFDVDPQEAEVARAMAAQAEEVTVLADSSKHGKAGVFEVLPLARVARIVCENMELGLRAKVEKQGVRIEIAVI